MTTLTHLTLNSRHLVTVPARPPRPDYLEIVAAGSGPIPDGEGWHIACLPVGPGITYLQIAEEPGLSQFPAIQGIACWDGRHTDAAWAEACHIYALHQELLQSLEAWREPPAQPAAPWLAVWYLPTIGLADRDAALGFGPAQQELAWALMAE